MVRLVILLALLLCGCATRPAAFIWKEDARHLALLQPDGHSVWRFNADPAEADKPCFHPLALPGGAPLTGFRPADHHWHYGHWFSWKYLNGVNYWELPLKGLTSWRQVKMDRRSDFSARIELELDYRPGAGAEPVLREQRRIDISPPAADGSYHLDWTLNFQVGAQDLTCDCSPVAKAYWGGYGGLSLRFTQAMSETQVQSFPEARRGKGFLHFPAAATDFSGLVAGQSVGVAMFDHPANRRRAPWYVIDEPQQPFLFLNAALLQDRPLSLRAGESLQLRYRVSVHPGAWDHARLEKEAAAFTQE